MRLLPARTPRHHRHDDVLGRHEGQLLGDPLPDDGGVDDEAGADVEEEDEAGVGAEIGFWKRDASNGAIVEGAFEPLCGVGSQSFERLGGEVAAEAAEAFGTHGVTFVSLEFGWLMKWAAKKSEGNDEPLHYCQFGLSQTVPRVL